MGIGLRTARIRTRDNRVVILLLSIGFSPWVSLIFAGWVLIVSVYILVLNLRSGGAGAEHGGNF